MTELLLHFSTNDRVTFVDINYLESGHTLQELLVSIYYKQSAKYYVKNTEDAFESINLDKSPDASSWKITGELGGFLKSKGVTRVMPTGCFDTDCVMETAKGAAEAGFKVIVDRDLTMKYHIPVHRDVEDKSYMQVAQEAYQEWQELLKEYPEVSVIESAPSPCE